MNIVYTKEILILLSSRWQEWEDFLFAFFDSWNNIESLKFSNPAHVSKSTH